MTDDMLVVKHNRKVAIIFMKQRRKAVLARLSLSCRACLYVSLHAAGISAIAQRHYLAAIIAGAVINYLWASNVRAVVPSDRLDRLCYSAGGATGMLVGLLVGQLLASFA